MKKQKEMVIYKKMRKWTNEENGLTSRKEKNGEKRKWEKRNSEKKER